MSMNETMKATGLQLADTVLDAANHEIGLLTVKQIKDGQITFVRPYIHTADFSYTGGVICYTGIEEFTHEINDFRHDYNLICRKPLK